MTVNLSILMPSQCMNNKFEFRVLTSPSVTFNCSAQGAIILDIQHQIILDFIILIITICILI